MNEQPLRSGLGEARTNGRSGGFRALGVWTALILLMQTSISSAAVLEKATVGGGCFWCVEAVFERFDGVSAVVSGYAGGSVPNPTYKQVCGGDTGHAEVIQIEFDPAKISFSQLLDVFWEAHDPTTLNRQGADEGTQYRSVIFYHNEAQKAAAEKSMASARSKFKEPISTELAPLKQFYAAEDSHQDYFRKNPRAPYCAIVISPKLLKLQKKGVVPAAKPGVTP